jgi:hypothetical protein
MPLRATLAALAIVAVGRAYPVCRELLLYAAQMQRRSYGAAVVALEGVGQIAVMAMTFIAAVALFGERRARWIRTKPHQPVLASPVFAGDRSCVFHFLLGHRSRPARARTLEIQVGLIPDRRKTRLKRRCGFARGSAAPCSSRVPRCVRAPLQKSICIFSRAYRAGRIAVGVSQTLPRVAVGAL